MHMCVCVSMCVFTKNFQVVFLYLVTVANFKENIQF